MLSLAAILQVVTLILMIVYIVSLLFDFEELFDFSLVNKDDLPVKLTDLEIDEIGKEVKTEMNMTDQLGLTLRQKEPFVKVEEESDVHTPFLMLSQTLPWHSFVDLYYFLLLVAILMMQIAKITLLQNDQTYITMMDTMLGNLSFDCTECLIGSPRVMSIFTLALTAGCNTHKPGVRASAT